MQVTGRLADAPAEHLASRGPRVGLGFLNLAPSPERGDTEALFTEMFEDAVWADEAGFDGLWVTEHHFSTYSLTSSPLLLLGQVAALAPRLRLGTSVLVLPLWDPVRLACDVSTLDVLSGGRLDLGIGRGYQPHEFRVFGRELDDSRARYEETALVVRKLLSERDASFAGAFHRLGAPATVLPRVAQLPHPPIWAAALSPDSVDFAVREGFHFMVNAAMPEAAVRDYCRTVHRSLSSAAVPVTGREIAANRFVYVGTDPAIRRLAVREVARQLATSHALAQGAVPLGGTAPYPRDEHPSEGELAAAEELLVAGSAAEVADRLAQLADAGVTYVIAGFRFGRFPSGAARESMHAFAEECLPRTSGRGAGLP